MLYGSQSNQRVTTHDLRVAKQRGEKWPMITSYDALTAELFDECGFPVILVGDSAAMVVFGYDSTIPVTTDELLPLVAAVERNTKRAMIVADLPFGSYQESAEQALTTATTFMKQGHAHAVKLEGGRKIAPQVKALTDAGIAVMGHLGLTPQAVHSLGGYRVQGRGEDAERIIEDAHALVEAGVFAIVLEVMPQDLAARITQTVAVPTIGIGAGASTDAQVIVWQDLLGLTPGKPAKFVRQYADLRTVMTTSVQAWATDVVNGIYPDAQHVYD